MAIYYGRNRKLIQSIMITFEQKGKVILYVWREIWPRCTSAFLTMLYWFICSLHSTKTRGFFSHKQWWLWTFSRLIIKCKTVHLVQFISIMLDSISRSSLPRYFAPSFCQWHISAIPPSSKSFQQLISPMREQVLQIASAALGWYCSVR